MTSLESIPRPRSLPLLGNVTEVHLGSVLFDLIRLARELGPIYRVDVLTDHAIVLSSRELVDQVCDEESFDKQPLDRLRVFLADGLFTAWTDEPAWPRGHRVIAPSFSPQALKEMFPTMLDPVEQLCERLTRLDPGGEVDVGSLTTSLALETIALTSFSYRFGSFYREQPHPFVRSLQRVLELSMAGAGRPGPMKAVRPHQEREFRRHRDLLYRFIDGLIEERRARGEQAAGDDLLGRMLTEPDPQTGERLNDTEVRRQALTLMIAGHETTSGLISFALHNLAANPSVQERLRAQVDEVLGPDPNALPSYEQLERLDLIERVLSETLRLRPIAPILMRYPREDAVLGGRWAVEKGAGLAVLLPALHRDPAVWGEDADRFDPDRWAPNRAIELPPNSYKPFGTGVRACIGQGFALQEATLALAVILRRFEISDPRPGEELSVRVALTQKPRDLVLSFAPRAGVSTLGSGAAPRASEPEPEATGSSRLRPTEATSGLRLLLLHGSDGGTSGELVRELAYDADALDAESEVKPLGEAAGRLPTEAPMVIVAASYNGQPAEEAAGFVEWLANAPDGAAEGLRFAVFGVGDHHWATTYQRIPRLIDSELERLGGTRLVERGEGDAAGDLEGSFNEWRQRLWSELGAATPAPGGEGGRFAVEVVGRTPADGPVAAFGLGEAVVTETRELQRHYGEDPSPRSTRHLEIYPLDEEVRYRAGDHLLVMPHNLDTMTWYVGRALGFDPSLVVRLRSTSPVETPLPTDQPISAADLVRSYLDVRAPATRAGIEILASLTEDSAKRRALLELAGDDDRYRSEVLALRRSLIDMALDDPPDRPMPIEALADAFPLLKPRPYSIASSPRVAPHQISLTVGVLDEPSLAGHAPYRGVTSICLATRLEFQRLLVRVRDPGPRFRLPEDPQQPLIMICAGTGIAPFRGFLQERAAQRRDGAALGPIMLFRGCRRSDHDRIYGDELDAWLADGMLELEEAFSNEPGRPRAYVQDRVRERADRVLELIDAGGQVLVCGNGRTMEPDVRRTVAAIRAEADGSSADDGERWLSGLIEQGRYVEDVWGG